MLDDFYISILMNNFCLLYMLSSILKWAEYELEVLEMT